MGNTIDDALGDYLKEQTDFDEKQSSDFDAVAAAADDDDEVPQKHKDR